MSRSGSIQATYGSGDLARLTGVSTDTLRHYEKTGLLAAPPRTTAGYRRYPPDAVARVRLIQHALVVGFSLRELARVLRERDRGGAPCRQVRALVGMRIAELDARLKELTSLRREMRRLVRDWDRRLALTPAGTRAHLLETLDGTPAFDKPPRGRRHRTLAPRRTRT